MQDIGRCRAILPDEESVRAVLRRIERRWTVVDEPYDYIARPKATGYRAIHVVVLRDGRQVEIQLRTPAQQAWAAQGESIEQRTRIAIKDGEGPEELVRFLRVTVDFLARSETGAVADNGTEKELAELWPLVRAYFDADARR